MSEAQQIKNRVNRMIDLERERCRKVMGDAAWNLYGDWVTTNIVTAAKQWLLRELAEGRV